MHTKAIIVDDVFVGIGSCNTNRRGFFHDGEISAFAVPGTAQGIAGEPCVEPAHRAVGRAPRHPAGDGRALLADPVAAFELFRRPTLNGNRVSTFDALGIKPELGFPSESARG